MINAVIKAIEAVAPQLTSYGGTGFGAELSPAEAVVALHGDFLLSVGYAALFSPEILVRDGVPFAKFATAADWEPIDCFHVDLLHHSKASGRSSEAYAGIGVALAAAWTRVLSQNGIPGQFAYDSSTGFDIKYEP